MDWNALLDLTRPGRAKAPALDGMNISRSLHPYTAGMLSSTIVGHKRGTRVAAVPGTPPDLRRLPPGCSFAPRCPHVMTACTATFSPEQHFEVGRMACCLRLHQDGSLETAPL